MADKTIKSITTKTTVVNINSPKALADFSKELKEFIVTNKLYTGIKDKNYVHVEGWQFAGASMGLFPVIEKLEQVVGLGDELKYRAEVKILQLSTGTTVGYGIAICSNKEDKKKSFDEYAIASMAQTRAVGKAFRLSIGWVMKLSGYEPTPAEEMSSKYNPETIEEAEIVDTQDQMPIDDVKQLVESKLAMLDAPNRVKILKNAVNALNTNKLTEANWRYLYSYLTDLANQKKAEESKTK